MKTLKIALALVAVIGLAAVTVGLSYAIFTGTPFDYGRIYVQDGFDEDWWDEMREYMEARYRGIEDEAWFDDMFDYAQEHWDEVQDQEWFDDMTEYMEDHMDDIEDEDWFDEMEEHMDDYDDHHGCH